MKFIFCIVALLIQPFFCYLVYKKQDKRQAALNMPMLYWSGAYLVVQIYVFFKYCLKFPEEYQMYSYLLQSGILVVFLILECAFFFSNRYINAIEKKEQDSIQDFKQILQELEVKKVLVKDAEKADLLNQIYDKMRYADPVSSPDVATENRALMELVQQLNDRTEMKEFEEQCTQILNLLEVRKIKNTKVKG